MKGLSREAGDIVRRRLENQRLVSRTFKDPVEVVRALGAVQSQDYPRAKWALAQRTRGKLTEPDVERVIASGAILRTHVLRPTWHFVLPEDIRWMLTLTAPRVAAAMAYHSRWLELDERVCRRSNKAIERALRDGAALTRAELAAVLRQAGVEVSTQRVWHLLIQAELDRVVISGARRGAQFTYAAFDALVPAAPARDRDDALQELARRYFATRGPATLQDFAWWSGLTVADAKRGAEAAGASLKRETYDDRVYWSASGRSSKLRRVRVAHFLPNYDEFFVGFRDRSAFSERLRRVSPSHRVDALMGHILCIDGQIVGGWRRTLSKQVNVELRMLVPLTAAERKLVQRARVRFSAYLGSSAKTRSKL